MQNLKNILLTIESPLIQTFAKTVGSYEAVFVEDLKNHLADFYDNLDIIESSVNIPSNVLCLYIALVVSRTKKYMGINTTLAYNVFLNKNKNILERDLLLNETQIHYTIPFILQHIESLCIDTLSLSKNGDNLVDVYISSIVKTFYAIIGDRSLLPTFIKIFSGKKMHNFLRNIDEEDSAEILKTDLNIFFTCGDSKKIQNFINDSYFENKKCKILDYNTLITSTKTSSITINDLKEYDVVLINNATRSATRSLFYKEIKKSNENLVTFNTIIFASDSIPDDKYYADIENTYFSIPLVGYDCDTIVVN